MLRPLPRVPVCLSAAAALWLLAGPGKAGPSDRGPGDPPLACPCQDGTHSPPSCRILPFLAHRYRPEPVQEPSGDGKAAARQEEPGDDPPRVHARPAHHPAAGSLLSGGILGLGSPDLAEEPGAAGLSLGFLGVPTLAPSPTAASPGPPLQDDAEWVPLWSLSAPGASALPGYDTLRQADSSEFLELAGMSFYVQPFESDAFGHQGSLGMQLHAGGDAWIGMEVNTLEGVDLDSMQRFRDRSWMAFLVLQF